MGRKEALGRAGRRPCACAVRRVREQVAGGARSTGVCGEAVLGCLVCRHCCRLAGTNQLGSERGGRQQTQSRKIGNSRAESTGERQRAEKRNSRIKINKRLPLEAVIARSSSNTKFRSGAVGDSERWVSKEQQSFMGNKRETCSTDKCLREHPSD